MCTRPKLPSCLLGRGWLGVLDRGPDEERKTYNYHLHALQPEIRSQGPRRGSKMGRSSRIDDFFAPALGPSASTHTHTHSTAAIATPAATQLGHDKTGHDPTRRDTIRHKTKTSNRRYRSTHSGLTCTAKGPRPAACATLWAHVCMEDMLTPGGVRPLWAAGCGLCGLEAWHTVPKSGGIGTAAATVEERSTAEITIPRGPSAGQLSGPHRRRCSHVQ